nr:MAG TPA: hypothetical protein [Caudoviricetes sp.]
MFSTLMITSISVLSGQSAFSGSCNNPLQNKA